MRKEKAKLKNLNYRNLVRSMGYYPCNSILNRSIHPPPQNLICFQLLWNFAVQNLTIVAHYQLLLVLHKLLGVKCQLFVFQNYLLLKGPFSAFSGPLSIRGILPGMELRSRDALLISKLSNPHYGKNSFFGRFTKAILIEKIN